VRNTGRIKIILVGYGSQGSRIAEAISAQPDFKLLGIGLKEPDLSARTASRRRYPIYAMSGEDVDRFREARILVQGSLSKVLPDADVVVDATPGGVGKKNKQDIYSKYNAKCIFQAGEPLKVADVQAFMSTVNYEDATKSDSVRIPSPVTVSLMRTLKPLDDEFVVKQAACTLIQSGPEPTSGHSGHVEALTLDRPYGEQTVLHEELQRMFSKNLLFTSLTVPSVPLGVQAVAVDLERKVSAEQVINLLSKTQRVILIKRGVKLNSPKAVYEYVRRISRASIGVYELCVWHEHVETAGDRLKLVQAFDPHCVQTPEIMDAIRALASEMEMQESFDLTNKALRLLTPGIYS
jgi:glyceraldehyde-3-phosphate dehydrogenase (NAD(P))